MDVFFHASGLHTLDMQDETLAVARGCVPLTDLIRNLPSGSILIGSTNENGGWTGIYRKEAHRDLPVRVARYRDFSRTLRHALRLAA